MIPIYMEERFRHYFDSSENFVEEGRIKSTEYLQGYIDSFGDNCRVRNFLFGNISDSKLAGYSQVLEERK